MNAKTRCPAQAPHRRAQKRRAGGSRFVLTTMLSAIGLFLWVQPSAEAESTREAASVVGAVQPAALNPPRQAATLAAPFTVAANGPIRLTIGGADESQAGAAPAKNAKGPNCTGPVGEHSTVVVPLGKSTMINLREPVRERTVGNPQVVQAMLVSPQTLYLLGSDIGTTNMIVQGKSGSCSVIDVVVGTDPAGLQQTLASLMPEETGVQIKAAGDALVLTGVVTDGAKAQRIVELARAYTQRPSSALPLPGAKGGAGAAPAASGDKSERIINMLQVAAPQQVMLEVKVAEVSKTLIDQLGAQANLQGSIGSWSFGLLANFLSGGMAAIAGAKSNNLPLNLAIDAQKTDQLVKILAEPNLMAISGQEASFLAGGKVFIPVPQSNGTGGTTITLQEEQFGVGLTFTPTVLEGGRINLKVAPEVSELSPTGVAVTAGGTSSTAILPLITTRRASTTLQVYDGQSFAIGGLMKNNVTGTIKGLPGIGELPVLGALFRSTNYQQDKTELVFVVTPRLAKPLPREYPLPTDSFANVNEGNLYATGNMEGRKPAPPAAPASATPAVNGANGASGASSAGPVAVTGAVAVVPPVAGPAAMPPAAPVSTQAPGPDAASPANLVSPGGKPIALDEPRVNAVQTAQISVTPLPASTASVPDESPPTAISSARPLEPGPDTYTASPPVSALASSALDPPDTSIARTVSPATQISTTQ
ncbi:pilus assembly protein N-terminal domain-containing protein [Paraburkholderia gardini]|uniref:Type 3 secretion system secretin n=1 Tax=Paraburkholderia gardini TaxID=2823469 RepID=A0ABM8U133_9BURK|nr:Type 3 secretion system secretin [Paraburkholderia gardini]